MARRRRAFHGDREGSLLRCLYDVRLHADNEYGIEETERPLTIASHRVITLRAWERRERRGVATTRTDATADAATGRLSIVFGESRTGRPARALV